MRSASNCWYQGQPRARGRAARASAPRLGGHRELAGFDGVTALYGKISDFYGRKPVFRLAIFVFLIGSALVGVSTQVCQLIGARGVQWLGAGGQIALTFAIIGDVIRLASGVDADPGQICGTL